LYSSLSSGLEMSIDPELLVSKGLFPENLPPVYTTRSIWGALNPKQTAYVVSAKAVGELPLYNASKRGAQRRIFAIPHPLFVKEQGLFFCNHWADINALFDVATGSASRPQLDNNGARYVRITPHSELPKIRLQRLSRFKFCLVTDVSRFYYSVYTHALPWALNGKAPAKKDGDWKNSPIFGNRLDFLLRQAQAKQTIGIPVGPDASKIAAEIIMSAVDQSFINRSGNSAPVYIRHVDDYWVGGHTHEECERHLTNLRAALKDYELDINETKTRIISTKYVFGETWPSEFEKAIEDTLRKHHQFVGETEDHHVLATLGRIVERATEDNDDGIIRNAIRVIDRKMLWNNNWTILEHFLAQCAVQFPHSFDYVARVIAWRNQLKQSVDLSMWKEIAQVATKQHSALGRDSETCWAIWLLKELGVKLPRTLSDSVLENCSGFVLAFLAHFPKSPSQDFVMDYKAFAA
jgi:Reverse transcriptase (RNA-dependent DNA polymerase)